MSWIRFTSETPLRVLLLLLCMLVTAPGARALDCSGNHFRPAATLSALPDDLRDLIAKELGRMADPGQRLQDTDVIDEPNLPGTRLALAAVDDRRVVMSVEGRTLSAGTWVFDKTGDRWAGHQVVQVGTELPVFMAELLYPICRGYPIPEPRPERAVNGLATSNGSIVLTLFNADSSMAYKLNRDPVLRGTSKFNQIAYLQTNRPLTAGERAVLRRRLAALHVALPKDAEIKPFVSDYLEVLQTTATGVLKIGITDEGFVVERQTLRARAQLLDAIRMSGATKCHVVPNSGTQHAQVAQALSAVQEAGCGSNVVAGNRR